MNEGERCQMADIMTSMKKYVYVMAVCVHVEQRKDNKYMQYMSKDNGSGNAES